VDTSALLAMLDAGERRHKAATKAWRHLLDSGEALVSSNYVLVEVFALAQARLGMEASRAVERDLCPALAIHWIDEEVHRAAVSSMLTASRRKLGLVDSSSFEVMRRRGLTRAFTLDRHFADQGFETIP
jgi:predicted nucleic acid-binding protein